MAKAYLERQISSMIRSAALPYRKRARWVDSPSNGFFSSLSTAGDDAEGELESALSAARRKLADLKGRPSQSSERSIKGTFVVADDEEDDDEVDADEELPFVVGTTAML